MNFNEFFAIISTLLVSTWLIFNLIKFIKK